MTGGVRRARHPVIGLLVHLLAAWFASVVVWTVAIAALVVATCPAGNCAIQPWAEMLPLSPTFGLILGSLTGLAIVGDVVARWIAGRSEASTVSAVAPRRERPSRLRVVVVRCAQAIPGWLQAILLGAADLASLAGLFSISGPAISLWPLSMYPLFLAWVLLVLAAPVFILTRVVLSPAIRPAGQVLVPSGSMETRPSHRDSSPRAARSKWSVLPEALSALEKVIERHPWVLYGVGTRNHLN